MKQAYGHYQNAGGARDAAQTLMDMGQIDVLMENHDRARVNFTQARTMYKTLNVLDREATALRAIGDLEAIKGRLPQAQVAYAEGRGLFQQAGDRIGEADALFLIGILSINIDNATEAKGGGREPGTGSVSEITDDFKRVRDLGYRGFIVRYRGDDAAEQQRQMSRFAAEIAPHV